MVDLTKKDEIATTKKLEETLNHQLVGKKQPKAKRKQVVERLFALECKGIRKRTPVTKQRMIQIVELIKR